jgi:hypothetical protein
MAAFGHLQGAPDWPVQGDYEWFIEYYLHRMKQASDSEGKRLLDVLDVHWYPEAYGDIVRIVFSDNAGTEGTQRARVKAPRTLWDPAYATDTAHENSWIANEPYWKKFLPLIPRLKEAIDTYFPGTKLSITEWNYGGGEHFTDGIATADMLGIFGKTDVYIGTLWKSSSDEAYISAAFKLYRNYDSANATFGDISVRGETDAVEKGSVYASVFEGNKSRLYIILINKDFNESMNTTIDIYSGANYSSGQVYAFDNSGTAITQKTGISSINGNIFSYTVAPLTACYLILEYNNQAPPPKVVSTTTPEPTPTPLPQSASGNIKLQYRCSETAEEANQIRMEINIINNSTASVAMNRLTARYYFVREGAACGEEFNVDYTELDQENITATFISGACDIKFLAAAGSLAPGSGTGAIPIRINKKDWTNFRQNNDYSFDPSVTSLSDYIKTTLFLDGEIIWGTEPGYEPGVTPDPTDTPTSLPTGETTPTPLPSQLDGDVNGNGSVDIVDALLVAQYYVGLGPDNFNPDVADVNCNDTIDIVDALLIAQFYVGLIIEFC